jgi:Histidine kinase
LNLSEIQHSFGQRLRTPRLWGVFFFPSLLLSLHAFYRQKAALGSISWVFLFIQLIVPFIFYLPFVWLADFPWQWDGRPGLRSTTWRGAAQAFLFAEIYMTALVFFDHSCRRIYGVPVNNLTYLLHLCFQGPALFLVGNLIAHRERTELEKVEMKSQVAEAQLHQLRGQLHPHVLFNALNGLAELVEDDQAAAEVHIQTMSSLLRRILQASEIRSYPLSQERDLIRDYLDLEAMRLGSRLRVRWEWDKGVDGMCVPPLLLQPLVENAIKHGIAPTRGQGDLLLKAARRGQQLWLEVRNTGDAPNRPSTPSTGIGVKNLQRRLQLAFGDGASFELRRDDLWTVAAIHLNLEKLNPAYGNS